MTAHLIRHTTALLLPLLVALSHAQDTDSLTYMAVRDEIRQLDSYPEEYEAYIEAAEELAAEELYEEAHELLVELFAGLLETDEFDTATVPTSHTGHDTLTDREIEIPEAVLDTVSRPGDAATESDKPNLTWRVNTSVSYDRFDDIYLTSTDEDTLDSVLDSLDEIDEQPLNGYARASLEWKPKRGLLRHITPSVYASNTRVRGGVDLAGTAAGRVIDFDAGFEAEKRMFEDYGDSSDALKGEARLELTSRPLTGRFHAFLPVEVETEQYRAQRPRYTSYWELSAQPTVAVESPDFSRRLELGWEHLYRKHHGSGKEDDEVEYGPRLLAEFWGTPLSVSLDGSLRWERFPYRTDPGRQRELRLYLRTTLRPLDWLEFSINAEGFGQREWYNDQTLFLAADSSPASEETLSVQPQHTVTGSYTLDGYGVDARPSLRFRLPFGLGIQPAFAYERRRYPGKTHYDSLPLFDTLYVSESYNAYEPGISLVVDKKDWYASVGFSYRREDIISEHYLTDFDALRPKAELTWRIRPWATVDLYASYDRRKYDTGEVEENISGSVSARLRF